MYNFTQLVAALCLEAVSVHVVVAIFRSRMGSKQSGRVWCYQIGRDFEAENTN
jgi:hypothetical protein